MSDNDRLNFLNSLLRETPSKSEEREDDDDLGVVEATFKVRLANPKRLLPAIEGLLGPLKESPKPETEKPPITGISAGVRMPDAVPARTEAYGAAPPPVRGARVDATTRQVQDYTVVPSETPELVPNTISVAPDYNPEYQRQFDRYLNTNEFEYMYGPALRGIGAPMPSTPRF